jgi:hypothetical protein
MYLCPIHLSADRFGNRNFVDYFNLEVFWM